MSANKLVALTLCAAFGLAANTGNAHGGGGNTLSFHNTHTGESITANPDTAAGQRQINHVLRDHRNGQVTPINPRLLDRLERIEAAIERARPGRAVVFNVISGYRSPATNEMLRSRGGGQAKNSQHTHGNAIDIRVPGVSTRQLRDIAWCEGGGGVGYYPKSAFVHIDTARKRTWPGAWERGVRC